MTSMPHLSVMNWNYRDQLSETAKTMIYDGTPGTTYYIYDSGEIRSRKITRGQNTSTRREERIYLGDFEIYRRYKNDGTIELERETLHILDDKNRIALVETKTIDNDANDNTSLKAQIIRYQYSNHLGSACVELDDKLNIVSYEEYHPYGTTSYQAMNDQINPVFKRYRYTGLERDEENGFGYHQARYYVPWVGRWLNPDPVKSNLMNSQYTLSRDNPINFRDPSGLEEIEFQFKYIPSPLKYVAVDYGESSPLILNPTKQELIHFLESEGLLTEKPRQVAKDTDLIKFKLSSDKFRARREAEGSKNESKINKSEIELFGFSAELPTPIAAKYHDDNFEAGVYGPQAGADLKLKYSGTGLKLKGSAGVTLASLRASAEIDEAKISASADVGFKASGEFNLSLEKIKFKGQLVVFAGGSVNVEINPKAIAKDISEVPKAFIQVTPFAAKGGYQGLLRNPLDEKRRELPKIDYTYTVSTSSAFEIPFKLRLIPDLKLAK
jgi:RHS repeat-associated protein